IALLRMFQLFEHQHAGALAHHKSIPLFVERPRGVAGIVIARAQRLHGAEPADADGHDRGLRPTGEDDLRIPHLDGAPGFAQGVVGRGTSRAGRKIGSPQLVVHREQARAHVGDEHGNHECRKPVRPAFEQNLALLGDGLQAADARADEHANLVAIHLLQIQTRIEQGPPARIHGELRKTVRAPHFLGRRQRGERIKRLYFSGNLRVETGRIEASDLVDAALAVEQAGPEGIHLVSQWSHRPQAGNDDPALCPVAGHKIKRGSLSWCQSKPPRKCLPHSYFCWASSMYLITSPTLWSFSACSSGISLPNSSSSAMTNSTVSSESAPRSAMNLASGVAWSAFTPNCSTMMSLTLCSIVFSAMICSSSIIFSVSMPRFERRQARNRKKLHGHPAIYRQHLAGDVARRRAGQEQNGVGHVVRLAQVAQRNLLQQPLARLRT